MRVEHVSRCMVQSMGGAGKPDGSDMIHSLWAILTKELVPGPALLYTHRLVRQHMNASRCVTDESASTALASVRRWFAANQETDLV